MWGGGVVGGVGGGGKMCWVGGGWGGGGWCGGGEGGWGGGGGGGGGFLFFVILCGPLFFPPSFFFSLFLYFLFGFWGFVCWFVCCCGVWGGYPVLLFVSHCRKKKTPRTTPRNRHPKMNFAAACKVPRPRRRPSLQTNHSWHARQMITQVFRITLYLAPEARKKIPPDWQNRRSALGLVGNPFLHSNLEVSLPTHCDFFYFPLVYAPANPAATGG